MFNGLTEPMFLILRDIIKNGIETLKGSGSLICVWYVEERRMLLSGLETARMVYMLKGKSASNRERSRSRVREDVDIDQLAGLMSHTSPDPNL